MSDTPKGTEPESSSGRHLRRGKSLRLWIPVGAFVLAVAALLVGFLNVPKDNAMGFQLRAQVTTGTINFAIALISTAVVSFLIAEHIRDRTKGEADADRRRQEFDSNDRERRRLVGDLRDVDNAVSTSALRIRAHQTVRTYGTEMRDVVLPKLAQLEGVRSDITACRGGLSVEVSKTLDCLLNEVASYLRQLTDEFEVNYIEASLLQEAQYKWRQQRVAELVTRRQFAHAPPKGYQLPEQPETSCVWAHLTEPASDGIYKFPRLRILLELSKSGSTEQEASHQKQFSERIRRAMNTIDQAGRHLSTASGPADNTARP